MAEFSITTQWSDMCSVLQTRIHTNPAETLVRVISYIKSLHCMAARQCLPQTVVGFRCQLHQPFPIPSTPTSFPTCAASPP